MTGRCSKGTHHVIRDNPDLELTPELLGVQGSYEASRGAEEFFAQGFRQRGANLLNKENMLSFDRTSRAGNSLNYIESFFEEILP
jgi:hypothetical protein